MPKLQQLSAKAKARKFRALLPQIERKIAEGVRHRDIIEALAEEGLKLGENTYFTYLRRYRKTATQQGQPWSQTITPPQPASMGAVPPMEPRATATERPPKFDYNPRGNPDLLK